MKKIILLFSLLLSLVSCSNAQNKQSQSSNNSDVLEVMYFHGKQRCMTCLAIESLTTEVLNADYAQQVNNGKIVYKVIDISTEEGEKIADRYEVTWSSLILDKNGKTVNLTDMAFSYARSQPEVFKVKLKEEINKSLK